MTAPHVITDALERRRQMREDEVRLRYRLGAVDLALAAAACPGGCQLGATTSASGCLGTGRKWCPGFGAFLCDAGFAAWDAAGRPLVSNAAVLARQGGRLVPPPIPLAPARSLPRNLADAPTDLTDWSIYGPHMQNARGQFHDEQQRGLRALAQGWDADWPEAVRTMPWLVLLGPPGTGKTMLLRTLCRRAHVAGLRAGYVMFDDLLRRVKATRAPDALVSEEDLLGKIERLDLLAIDDVRPVFGTLDDENIADRIIKRREGTERGEPRRATLLAANLTFAELESVVGAAAHSRIAGAAVVWPCDWPSHADRRRKP